MRTPNRFLAAAGVTILLMAGTTTPALAHGGGHGHGHHRHGHGHSSYQYVYYRSYPIYHAPDRNLWFWYDAGRWSFGAALPVSYHHYLHDSVRVSYADPYPYSYYSETRIQYPPRHVYRHGPRHGYGGRPHHEPQSWHGERHNAGHHRQERYAGRHDRHERQDRGGRHGHRD